MDEYHYKIIKQLFDRGESVQWYDSTEGRYYPILRIGKCKQEDRVGDDFMDAQFVYSNNPFSVASFYNTCPNEYVVVGYQLIFKE